MKSIFDDSTKEELIARINSLTANNNTQWGKMNLYQMLKHCTLWEEWISGKQQNKRVLIGRIFGRMALKAVLKDETPLRRNSPTIKEFKVREETGDIDAEKEKWIALLQANVNFPNSEFVHSFFGKMTKEQIGYMAYKHADHHLRQFNA